MRNVKTMDGNTAAAYISYAFTEVAAIYPITPSSPMAEEVDEWAAHGKKNIFGDTVHVVEMQAEGGAAGAFHGSLQSGALTTTYTASQGMLLMVPNMYKVAGELLPGVFHIAARALANHALSIFGDHQDVMSARATGCAMLAEANAQEIMDLAGVAHLAAIKGRVPFINFFDGFRTSHEIQKVEVLDYEELAPLIDQKALADFRARALNPDHPVIRGTAENPDVYFQHCEAANPFYNALPDIVQGYMDEISKITGRSYHLFDYYGAADADRIIIAIGSVTDICKDVTDALNANGEKVGVLNVHLYRPFSVKHFLDQIPSTVKKIAVLDRTREPGAIGEPLYLDVVSAIASSGRAIKVCGGRYGLGSKDVIPEDIMAVYEHLKEETPRHNFTLSIKDDVTNLSLAPLPVPEIPSKLVSCKFWGFGSDGTVGANKSAIKIIGDHTDLYAQGYFAYDSKKSGGVTISHLRFGPDPIRKPYLIRKADYIACHRPSYIYKYDLLRGFKPGGIFLLNSPWRKEDLDRVLPAAMKRKLAALKAKFYIIDAFEIAKNIGLGGRINMIMQSAFFHLTHIIPDADAVKYLKDSNEKSYGRKGQNVVDMNNKAVDAGMEGIVEVEVPAEWEHATTGGSIAKVSRPDFVKNVCDVMNRQEGDDLPVSTWKGIEDGTFPSGTSQYERPSAAIMIPEWIPENCIGCNQCGCHPSIPRHRRRSSECAGRLHCQRLQRPGQRTQVPHRRRSGRLLRLRHLREYLPGTEESPRHAAGRDRAPQAEPLGLCKEPPGQRQSARQKEPQKRHVRTDLLRILRRLRRLRRDPVHQYGHPSLRRPHDDLQCDRLLLHLRRKLPVHAIYQEQQRTGTGLGKLPLRRQRGIWPRHAPR